MNVYTHMQNSVSLFQPPILHDEDRYAATQSSAGGGPVSQEAVEVLEDLEAGRGETDPDLQVHFLSRV